jgi:hypothetical protein
MVNKARSTTLPSYKFLFPSEISGVGYLVTSAGDVTAKDTWALVPGGLSPANPAPVTATAPQTTIVRGQDAASSFASAGGDVNITPGVGSIDNASGNVVIKDTAGNSGWNTAHLRMGIYHFWVDSSSRLRVKNSAPISDTDGTVVGTQT